MAGRGRIFAASAGLSALGLVVVARLDPTLDEHSALLLLGVGAAYGLLVALLLRALPLPSSARPWIGLVVGPLPVALLLPGVRFFPGLETLSEARVVWIGATAALGFGIGRLEAALSAVEERPG